jgi:hypothetical protein
MAAWKREDWNEIIQEVNDILQNPPSDTDCEPLPTIDEVGENHRWSKGDIEEVQEALKATCPDIEFDTIPELWKQSIIDEINEAMEQAWCDCEDDDEPCDESVVDAENGLEFSLLNNAPPRIGCNGDDGEALFIRDAINGMQVGVPGIFNRIWRVIRRNTNVNGGGGISTTVIASGIVSCQGVITYTGNAQMHTFSGVSCGDCCPGATDDFCLDVLAICADQLANGFILTSEWLVQIDTTLAFCALEDDDCP